MSTADFRRQVGWLRSVGDIVDLSAMLDGSRNPAGGFNVAITFDDGYADTVETGLDIFGSDGIPITWFVSSGFVRHRDVFPWWNMLERLDDGALRAVKRELMNSGMKVLGQAEVPDAVFRKIATLFRESDYDRLRQLSDIVKPVFARECGDARNNGFATEDMIRDAAASKWITLGAHTTWHVATNRVTRRDLQQDLAANRRDLETWSGQRLDLFAYPYGGADDYAAENKATIEASGFGAAVTTIPGYVTDASDRYALGRITVRPTWTLGRFKAVMRYPTAYFGLANTKARITETWNRS